MGKWMSRPRRRYSETDDGIRSSKSVVNHKKSNSLDYGMMNKERDSNKKWMGMMNVTQCHTDAISSVTTLQPNLCISGSKDKSVVVQNFDTGIVLQTWADHKREVTKVRCINRMVASASRDLSVKIWDIDQSGCIGTLKGHKLVVTAVDFNNDNSKVCSGSRDNSLRLWDVETEECISECTLSRNLVTDVRWVKGENVIVQTSEDKVLKLWDPRTLEIVHSFPIQNQIQTCCDTNGLYCITGCNGFGGQGCQIHLWDLRQRAKLQEYRSHTETVSDCVFIESSTGSRAFTSCSHDGTVRLWQEHKQQHTSFVQLNIGTLTSIAPLNKDTLLCGSFEQGIHVLRIGINGRLISAT